ncbi:hypothetical protein [Sphingorhabdus sp.]|uniref:hypothetical protein n=1 Tax=Sphingorhabdus sp. TaxID=1902408 RepID=UPI0035944359
MRISDTRAAWVAFIALSGCGGGDLNQAENKADEEAALNGKIECALSGSRLFERTCTTEQISASGGDILVIRHPDGGFRRFDILTDGRGLAPADGFDETRIDLLSEGLIEVSSGDDKYRLPAQIKGNSASTDIKSDKEAG